MQVLNEMAGNTLSQEQLQEIADNLPPVSEMKIDVVTHPDKKEPKRPRILIKKKERLFDALKMTANIVDTGENKYYFMPCYFKPNGLFNLEVVPLDNPPQDLIDYLNKRREGEQEQQ